MDEDADGTTSDYSRLVLVAKGRHWMTIGLCTSLYLFQWIPLERVQAYGTKGTTSTFLFIFKGRTACPAEGGKAGSIGNG